MNHFDSLTLEKTKMSFGQYDYPIKNIVFLQNSLYSIDTDIHDLIIQIITWHSIPGYTYIHLSQVSLHVRPNFIFKLFQIVSSNFPYCCKGIYMEYMVFDISRLSFKYIQMEYNKDQMFIEAEWNMQQNTRIVGVREQNDLLSSSDEKFR